MKKMKVETPTHFGTFRRPSRAVKSRSAIRRVIEEAQLPDLKYVVLRLAAAPDGPQTEPIKTCDSAL